MSGGGRSIIVASVSKKISIAIIVFLWLTLGCFAAGLAGNVWVLLTTYITKNGNKSKVDHTLGLWKNCTTQVAENIRKCTTRNASDFLTFKNVIGKIFHIFIFSFSPVIGIDKLCRMWGLSFYTLTCETFLCFFHSCLSLFKFFSLKSENIDSYDKNECSTMFIHQDMNKVIKNLRHNNEGWVGFIRFEIQ